MGDESLSAQEAKLPPGPKTTYKFPESARQLPTDPKTVTFGLVLLGQQEEAEKAAEAKGTGAVWEVIKHGLVAVDGKPIGWENAEKERFLESLSPKIRSLLAKGFVALHAAKKEEEEDFLASAEVTV